jgi:Autotransporter beta-domain
MKKRIVLASIIFFTAISTKAQINKGLIMLGGDISASTQKISTINSSETYRHNGFMVSATVGKAIKDNFIIGVNAGYGTNKNEYASQINEIKGTSFSGGIFARQYKKIGKGDFYIFLQEGLGVSGFRQRIENTSPASNQETKRTSFSLTAYPGISYAVSKKLHLETGFNNLLSINYFTEKQESNAPSFDPNKTKGFSFSSSLTNATSSFYLGFRLFI